MFKWLHRCCTYKFYIFFVDLQPWVVVVSIIKYNQKKCSWKWCFCFLYIMHTILCIFWHRAFICHGIWNFIYGVACFKTESVMFTEAHPICEWLVAKCREIVWLKSIGEEAVRKDLRWMLWFSPSVRKAPFSFLAIWVWPWRALRFCLHAVFFWLAGTCVDGGTLPAAARFKFSAGFCLV